jgi:hypothetical protein
LEPLGALHDVKPDSLSFVQRLETIILDLLVVDENVLSIVNRDEAITLLGVEPLDFTFSHAVFSLLKK